jgi:hypothetical protein
LRFTACCGVLQTGAFIAELARSGSVDLAATQWSMVGVLVLALSFALALLPTFTTMALTASAAAATLLLALAPGASCVDRSALAGMTVGYLGVSGVTVPKWQRTRLLTAVSGSKLALDGTNAFQNAERRLIRACSNRRDATSVTDG